MARGRVTQWMLRYRYRKRGWLRVRRGHPNIHGMRYLVVLLAVVGAVHFDMVEITLVGVVGVTKIFCNDRGDRSGEEPK